MKKAFAWVISLVMIISLLAGCQSTAEPSGTNNASGTTNSGETLALNVGLLDGWTGFSTKYIVDNGLDLENGLKIEYMVFSSGAPANEAMTSGDLDCAIVGGGASVPALANLNSKMIMETNNDTVGMCLIARPEVAAGKVSGASSEFPDILGDAKSIKGLNIITSAGTLQYYLALKYIEALGLTTDDVNIISMDANQGFQAFELGEGDILACSNNFSFGLMAKGFVELASLSTLDCAATAQVVSSDAAFNNPDKFEALARYVKLLASVHDIMNNDTELATQCYFDWVTLNGGSPDMDNCRAIMETKPYYGVEDTKTRVLGQDFLNNFVEFYIMTEQIEEDQREIISANISTAVLEAAGFK